MRIIDMKEKVKGLDVHSSLRGEKMKLLKSMKKYINRDEEHDCNLQAVKLEKNFARLQIKELRLQKKDGNADKEELKAKLDILENEVVKHQVGIDWLKYAKREEKSRKPSKVDDNFGW